MISLYNNPRWLAQKFPVNKIGFISQLKTISVTTDTENSTVTYNLCPWQWKLLPNCGLMLLKIAHAPADGSDAFLVSLATTSGNTTTTTTSATPLVNGIGELMPSSEVVIGNRLLIYYNKCEGIFLVVNHIPTATTAP